MDIGTKTAAEILGISQAKVSVMCRKGVFSTATQDKRGSPWHIDEWEVRALAEKWLREGQTR